MTPALAALDTTPRRPWLAAADPRARLIAALAAVVAIVAVQRLDVTTALLAAALGLAVVAGVGAGELRHRLGHVEGFVVVLLLIVPWSVPGPALLTVGPLHLTAPGVQRAVLLALKLNAAALTLLALIGGVSPLRLAQALSALGAPDRLVQILLFAVRYVAVLREETVRLALAAKARGFRPTTSRHTLATLGILLGTVLVRAVARAERVGEAMRCRGFSGHFVQRALPPLTRRDRALVAAAVVFAALVLVGDRL